MIIIIPVRFSSRMACMILNVSQFVQNQVLLTNSNLFSPQIMVLCLICNFPHKLVRGMQLLHSSALRPVLLDNFPHVDDIPSIFIISQGHTMHMSRVGRGPQK